MLSRRDALKSTLALAAGALPLPVAAEADPDENTLLIKIHHDPSLSPSDVYTIVNAVLSCGAALTISMAPTWEELQRGIASGRLNDWACQWPATLAPTRLGLNHWERA